LCAQQNVRVRKVDALNYITTIAGTGVSEYSGDGGPATDASVSSTISGIYADLAGNVYFADMGNNRVRVVTAINGVYGPGITIFPNPATSTLTIISANNIASIVIYNILGQTVFNQAYNAEQVQINVADLADGVYFIKTNNTKVDMGNIKASRAITPQIPTPFFKIASKENKSNN